VLEALALLAMALLGGVRLTRRQEDESWYTPGCLGGRDPTWRRLTLPPRRGRTDITDITDTRRGMSVSSSGAAP